MLATGSTKACFLDRDGVVNEEVDYLCEPDKVAIIPGVPEALKMLKEAGFMTVVVTNQAGVARGMYEEKDILRVHERIQELLRESGIEIDVFYYCPHHPDFTGDCPCRKPEPGMFLNAVREYNIDVSRSFMVGDRMSDINAARAAGCGSAYLVRTGYGNRTIANGENDDDVIVAADLLDAVSRHLKLKIASS